MTESFDLASVLAELSRARVQFVVIGDPEAGPLRLVVSRHPTNLHALAGALDRLGATLRQPAAGTRPESLRPAPQRVGDELGTVAVSVAGVEVQLHVGGPGRSLYAETAALASDRVVEGMTVKWIAGPVAGRPPPPSGGETAGRRLAALADEVQRRAGLVPERGEDAPSGDDAPRVDDVCGEDLGGEDRTGP